MSVCFMCNGLGCVKSSESSPESTSPLKALATKIESEIDTICKKLRTELESSEHITHRDYHSVCVFLTGLHQLTDQLFDHID